MVKLAIAGYKGHPKINHPTFPPIFQKAPYFWRKICLLNKNKMYNTVFCLIALPFFE
jgi:hypothetical protein